MLKFSIFNAPQLKTSSKGNPYKTQEAFVHLIGENGEPERFPRRTELLFRASEEGYAPGEYAMAPQSVRVGQYDRLELGRVVLLPLAAVQGDTPPAREGGRK